MKDTSFYRLLAILKPVEDSIINELATEERCTNTLYLRVIDGEGAICGTDRIEQFYKQLGRSEAARLCEYWDDVKASDEQDYQYLTRGI